MDEQRRQRLRQIMPLLAALGSMIIVLILVAVMFLQWQDRREHDRKTGALLLEIQEAQTQQLRLETEIQNKRDELHQMEAVAYLCLTAKVDTQQQLAQVRNAVATSGYPLTVVLDVELPWETRQEILAEVEQHLDWQVIFTGSQPGWVAQADALAAQIPQAWKFAYVEEMPDQEVLEAMTDLSWRGYSISLGNAEHIQTQWNAGGLSSVGHIVLEEENSLMTVTQEAIENGTGFLLSVEMENVGKTFTVNTVVRVLDRFQRDYVSQSRVVPVVISECLRLGVEAQERKNQATWAVEEFIAQNEHHIQILEEKIQKLYAQVEALEYENKN